MCRISNICSKIIYTDFWKELINTTAILIMMSTSSISDVRVHLDIDKCWQATFSEHAVHMPCG